MCSVSQGLGVVMSDGVCKILSVLGNKDFMVSAESETRRKQWRTSDDALYIGFNCVHESHETNLFHSGASAGKIEMFYMLTFTGSILASVLNERRTRP